MVSLFIYKKIIFCIIFLSWQIYSHFRTYCCITGVALEKYSLLICVSLHFLHLTGKRGRLSSRTLPSLVYVFFRMKITWWSLICLDRYINRLCSRTWLNCASRSYCWKYLHYFYVSGSSKYPASNIYFLQIKLWDMRMVKYLQQYEGHNNSYAYLPLHVIEEEGLLIAGMYGI